MNYKRDAVIGTWIVMGFILLSFFATVVGFDAKTNGYVVPEDTCPYETCFY